MPPVSMRPASEARGEIAVRVYYEDTDFSGRVYHASYLRFLERGRTEWLRARGLTHHELAASSGIVLVVRSMQIDFVAPARIDDMLAVETVMSTMGGASMEFRQRIVLEGRALVTAKVLAAAVRDGRPARLPAALRAELSHSTRAGEG
jgi:acyl-CoA thioester hydrolase